MAKTNETYTGMIVFADGNIAYSETSEDFEHAYESYIALMNHLTSDQRARAKARGVVTRDQAREWLSTIADTSPE